MNPRHDERYEHDATPSGEITRRYREAIARRDSQASLALVHYRGGEEEFEIGRQFCGSTDPLDRATGADVLAQLGWGDQSFREESIALLKPMLDDPDRRVIRRAAIALGHRMSRSAIPALARLAQHSDSQIRQGVVHGLLCQEDDLAIETMIRLAADKDRDVRSWAVFGLGSLIDTDTPEIRTALRRALSDADHEIRGEALVGLAMRKDDAIVDELIREWSADFVSWLSLEAAVETADPRLHSHLKELAATLSFDDEDRDFVSQLENAISACKPRADENDNSGEQSAQD